MTDTLDEAPPLGADPPAQPKRGPGRPAGKSHHKARDKAPGRANTGGAVTQRAALLGRKFGEMLAAIGGVLSLRDPHCGTVIVNGAPALGKALGGVARENPRVLAMLDGLTKGGVYGELVFAVLAIALPIAEHHGVLPPLPAFIGGSGGTAESNGASGGAPPPFVVDLSEHPL